jgi:hypothetical protein
LSHIALGSQYIIPALLLKQGDFADAMYDLLKRDGAVNFQAFANIIGVVCNGSLNARLVMLLRLFG